MKHKILYIQDRSMISLILLCLSMLFACENPKTVETAQDALMPQVDMQIMP